MTKIEGYEDCHIVNESNGGEIRQGDASTRKDEVLPKREITGLDRCTLHPPTRTREELVEIMLQTAWSDEGAIFAHPDSEVRAFELFKLIQNRNFHSALDALIAIGAVRVK